MVIIGFETLFLFSLSNNILRAINNSVFNAKYF
jgi:hypothetical protein